ncbi:hypothetical protein GY15_00900 [Delftia sp. 670]|nr:hypothetical protein GY15_00900 [Delftia sp. 670]
MPVRAPAGSDQCVGGAGAAVAVPVVQCVHGGRQHGDAARHLAQAEVLHQHRAQLVQCALLVGVVHGRARIDHVAQRSVVEAVHRGVFHQQLDDGGHGEEIGDPVPLNQLPDLGRVQPVGGGQHCGRTARHVEQGMYACAVRQRCHGNGAVALVRARDQVGKVVGHHEGHLSMGEHRGLGPACGAGGVEEPQRRIGMHMGCRCGSACVVMQQLLVVLLALAFARPADGDHMPQPWRGGAHGVHMAGEALFGQHGGGAAGVAQPSHFGWCKPEVDRHPDGAEPEGGPAAFKQGNAVARLHQQAVTGLHAQRAQALDQRIDARIDLRPGPAAVALDQAGPVGKQGGRLRQQQRQVGCLGRGDCRDVRRCKPVHAASSTLR